jgi:hypothetical protein
VTHVNDPAPNVPPSDISLNGMYEHISPAYHISSDNLFEPTLSDITIVTGSRVENPMTPGSDGSAAHNFYFNHISDGGTTSVVELATSHLNTLTPTIVKLLSQFPSLRQLLHKTYPSVEQILVLFGILPKY